MATLPWNKGIIDWFLQNRIDWLTQIFVAITFLGNEMGYILLVVTIYWLFNKRLAVQLVIAVILTSFINHTLKIIIRNPRPYVTEGTYHEKWAIPEADIEETAESFSTPSGHAQGSSTFWWYLHLKVKSRLTFVLLPLMVFLIGMSRPYLGVHYVEDIILGWIIGFFVVVLLYRYDDKVSSWWNGLSIPIQLIIGILIPLTFTILAGIFSDYSPDGSSYVTLMGILSGIILGLVLDKKYLDFNPELDKYDNFVTKLLISIGRMVIGLIIVAIFLIGLDEVFIRIAADDTLLGFIFRWIRYLMVSSSGLFLAPLIFKKVKLS